MSKEITTEAGKKLSNALDYFLSAAVRKQHMGMAVKVQFLETLENAIADVESEASKCSKCNRPLECPDCER